MKANRLWPVLLLACAASAATAQAINAIWNGDWQLEQTNQVDLPKAFQVASPTDSTRLTAGSLHCDLAYDGLVTRQAILDQIDATRDWQLRADHWPAGTNTRQLFGLRREFDEAARIVQTLPPDSYRRVRLRGAGCESADDVFYVLNNGNRMFRIVFFASSLGVDVGVFKRIR